VNNPLNLGTLLTDTLANTLDVSLPLFRPELCLAATVVLLLLCRMLPVLRHADSALVALGGVAFGLWYAWSDLKALPAGGDLLAGRQELFTGLLVYDSLTAYIRLLLMGFLALYIVFTKVSGIPDREDGADFYTLVLGATLGMCLMASANHLLMLSWPSRWRACRRMPSPGCSRAASRAPRRRSNMPCTAPAPPGSCSTG
jgi:NADH-quinone oxidoreductase subunit N